MFVDLTKPYLDLFNPLNSELNPICHLLTLLGSHHIFHVSGIRVKYAVLQFFNDTSSQVI